MRGRGSKIMDLYGTGKKEKKNPIQTQINIYEEKKQLFNQ
jgi:hypothetical protein